MNSHWKAVLSDCCFTPALGILITTVFVFTQACSTKPAKSRFGVHQIHLGMNLKELEDAYPNTFKSIVARLPGEEEPVVAVKGSHGIWDDINLTFSVTDRKGELGNSTNLAHISANSLKMSRSDLNRLKSELSEKFGKPREREDFGIGPTRLFEWGDVKEVITSKDGRAYLEPLIKCSDDCMVVWWWSSQEKDPSTCLLRISEKESGN
jgi:hypothetical protein